MSTPAHPIPSPWGKPASPKSTSPWGSLATSAPKPCSLQDVMSEELAKELHDKEETKIGLQSEAVGGSSDVDLSTYVMVDKDDSEMYQDFLLAQSLQDQFDAEGKPAIPSDSEKVEEDHVMAQKLQEELNVDQDPSKIESDLLLAQMLQHEFDREHDEILRREENKLNGSSKVTLNFTNYRSVHPALAEDEDSEEEEDYLWEETPEKDTTPKFKKGSGISGKGKNIVTKHDAAICGRKNATRVMDRFPPEFETGDGCGIDMKLSNKVYNKLKIHSDLIDKRSQRLHEKKEHSTAAMAVDQKTRLILYKMVNNEVLENVNGVISAGKEAVVFHADGGSMTTDLVPSECAIKVFKTTLNEFKNRTDYIQGDYRFTKENAEFKKQNPRIIIKMWAQKEEQNLRRLEAAKVPCPHVVMLRKHVLLMSFIGQQQQAAPKLKDATLSLVDMQMAYEQTLEIMKKMYHDAGLVHGDFSEYNLLWHDKQVYVIDVSQAVERRHPQALYYLLRDCRNISAFFQKNGVPNVPDKFKLFNDITGLDLKEEDDAFFLKKLQDYEKNEEKLRMEKGKEYPFEYFFNEAKREREEAQKKIMERLGQSSSDDDSESDGEDDSATNPATNQGSFNPSGPGTASAIKDTSDQKVSKSGNSSTGSGENRADSASRSVRFKEADSGH